LPERDLLFDDGNGAPKFQRRPVEVTLRTGR
jgi:hypothetical protein